MTKADLKILERIFTAEIAGRLPAQFKSKHLDRLQSAGLVEPMTRVFGHDRFSVTVTGWTLTHLGRMIYCESCPAIEDESPVVAHEAESTTI